MKKLILIVFLLISVNIFAHSQYYFNVEEHEEITAEGETVFRYQAVISKDGAKWELQFPLRSESAPERSDEVLGFCTPSFEEIQNGFVMHIHWGSENWSFYEDFIFEEIDFEPKLVKIFTIYYDEQLCIKNWQEEKEINPPVKLGELTVSQICMYMEKEK